MANWIWKKYEAYKDLPESPNNYGQEHLGTPTSIPHKEYYSSVKWDKNKFIGITPIIYPAQIDGKRLYEITNNGQSYNYYWWSTTSRYYNYYRVVIPTNREWYKGPYIGEVTAEETAFVDNQRNSDGYWYVKDRLANVAPGVPASITTPANVDVNNSFTISWGISSDTNLTGYILERSINNGTYAEVYKGSGRSYSDVALSTWNSARYRVKGYDAYTEGSYRTGDIITIIHNQAPTISGSDEDLGTKINPFTKTFFVDDLDLTQTLNVVVKLNSSVIRTIDNASRKENYTVDINQARFDSLTIDTRNTIEISVTDTSGATAVRRWYFTRINTNPTVSVAMSNLGEQNNPFSFKFTADDADGDEIKAKIFIDDVQLADLGTITRGQQQTYNLGKFDYSKITNGTHKIKIEVTDSKNARGYGFVDFSKNITFARYKFTKEVTAQASTIIVNLMAEIAQGATVTIKVCNNAFDTNPTWETVPIELHGQAYNFKNTTKTASQWGVGVEVRIDRATAIKDSYFYGFVGAFS